MHNLIRPALAACALILLAPPATVFAQQSSVAGKWAGVFDTVNPDGSVEPATAVLSLAQSGSQVTGSAGDSPQHLSPVSGTLTGNTLSLAMTAQGAPIRFTLTLASGHLRGTVAGLQLDPGATIQVDAVPADANWQPSTAVPHAPDRLYANVAALDTKLFDAYNNCDLTTLATLVTDDLEFYHDKTGLAVGKPVFIESIRNNICGKVQRHLTPGSLEVHRLAHYGAIEIGSHTFSHPGDPANMGEAKFISVWQFKDGAWKLSRVLSYDHAPLQK